MPQLPWSIKGEVNCEQPLAFFLIRVSVSGFGVFVFIGAIGIVSVVGAVDAAVIGDVDDSDVVGFKADGAKGSAAALLGDLRMII